MVFKEYFWVRAPNYCWDWVPRITRAVNKILGIRLLNFPADKSAGSVLVGTSWEEEEQSRKHGSRLWQSTYVDRIKEALKLIGACNLSRIWLLLTACPPLSLVMRLGIMLPRKLPEKKSNKGKEMQKKSLKNKRQTEPRTFYIYFNLSFC